MNELSTIRIPVMSFRSSGVLYYEVNADHRNRLLSSSKFQENALKLEKRERYKGYVSDGVKKRMKKCITLLLQSTPYKYKTNPVTGRTMAHKVSFITLTTPTHEKSLDAKFCHKHLLEPLLRILRRKHNLKSYIWKVELQSNGQVHYHITGDSVIHHRELRNIWNGLLDKNSMLQEFEQRYGHKDPNSTDIHNVYKVRNLEAYLVKYICKEYQNETRLNAKIWDCSQNIKQADYFKFHLDTTSHQIIKQLQQTQQVITKYFEKAIFFDFKTNDYYTFFKESIINNFFEYLKSIQEWKPTQNLVKPTSCQKLKVVTSSLLTKVRQWKFQQLQLTYHCYTI
mgnify:CR=1 FL=1